MMGRKCSPMGDGPQQLPVQSGRHMLHKHSSEGVYNIQSTAGWHVTANHTGGFDTKALPLKSLPYWSTAQSIILISIQITAQRRCLQRLDSGNDGKHSTAAAHKDHTGIEKSIPTINSLSQAFITVILNAEAARNQNTVCAATFFIGSWCLKKFIAFLKSLNSVVKIWAMNQCRLSRAC